MATTAKFEKHLTTYDFELDYSAATLRALNKKALAELKKHVGGDVSVIHDQTIDVNPFSIADLQDVVEAGGWKVRAINKVAVAA